MIECGLLSGMCLRHFHKPLADMVICGSGPNLILELQCSRLLTGFPDPDLFDYFAHSGLRLSKLLNRYVLFFEIYHYYL